MKMDGSKGILVAGEVEFHTYIGRNGIYVKTFTVPYSVFRLYIVSRLQR